MTFFFIFSDHKDKLMLDFFLEDDSGKYLQVDQAKDAEPSSGGAKTQASSGISGDGQVAQLFRMIEGSLSEKLVEKTQAMYHFKVTGNEAGDWFLDLRTGKGVCGQGEGQGKADATLTMDSKNFFAMFTGKMKPTTAYMMGKLKISGNLQKAMKLEKLMGSLKSKM